ncbi:MAG: GNAT family N-acetyltransferase [bacterium]
MISIREFVPQFKDGVSAVISEVLYSELGFAPDPELDRDIREIEVQYSPPDGVFLVALDGESVVGTSAIRRLSEDDCELKRMFLLKEYRGRGIAKEMMTRLIDFARKRGYKRILLDTAQDMEAAIGLYRRFGFRETEDYNRNPRAQIFMVKELY